jgi:hypothetical protein
MSITVELFGNKFKPQFHSSKIITVDGEKCISKHLKNRKKVNRLIKPSMKHFQFCRFERSFGGSLGIPFFSILQFLFRKFQTTMYLYNNMYKQSKRKKGIDQNPIYFLCLFC